MKIVKTNKTISFKDVPVCGIFEFNNILFMKISPIQKLDDYDDADICDAIYLQTSPGDTRRFDDDNQVVYYPEATLSLNSF